MKNKRANYAALDSVSVINKNKWSVRNNLEEINWRLLNKQEINITFKHFFMQKLLLLVSISKT